MTLASLVDRLAQRGAIAIGFDILFAEPDRLSPPRIAESIPDAELKSRLAALPDSDVQLAEAISRARVVLGQGGASSLSAATTNLSELPITSVATIGDNLHRHLLRCRAGGEFAGSRKAAAGRGLFCGGADADGVIRRIPTLLYAEVVSFRRFRSLLQVATDARSSPRATRRGSEASSLPASRSRRNVTASFGYISRHDPRRYVSAADVLSGQIPDDRIEGKLVLIGTSAAGLFDLRTTPLERAMPGVEIHAQAIESILDNALLLRPNYALGLEISLAFVIGIGIIVVVPMLGARATVLLGIATTALLAALSGYLFVSAGI